MKDRNMFTTILLVLACFAVSPVAQARRPSEDRGNGNSAAENVQALNLSTTGSDNTAHGWFSLFSNTSGSSNTADGFQALLSNTTGTNNTATGFGALFSNTAGNTNTAMGFEALFSNTTASDNTATGFGALFGNTTGIENTAIGSVALNRNSTGDDNTATGFGALFSNTSGTENTATGSQALNQNTEGFSNTAFGRSALFSNTIGERNTAIGFRALVNNTTGSFNTAIGDGALSNSTGRDNTALGEGAGSAITTGSGNVHIGTFVTGFSGDETNTTRIRNIGLTPIVGGLPVVMEAFGPSGDGKLGIGSSSRRYKEDIKPMDKASERLFALRPVTFRAKENMDRGHVKHYGFIAEDVAAVDSDLVVYNAEGQPETLRFDSINAMLLNEFLEEHQKVQELEKQLEKLAGVLQKVSDKLELRRPAPRIVDSNQ
jgi:hypothetical protein